MAVTMWPLSLSSEVYKRDENIQPTFDPNGAIMLDDRLMSFKGSFYGAFSCFALDSGRAHSRSDALRGISGGTN